MYNADASEGEMAFPKLPHSAANAAAFAVFSPANPKVRRRLRCLRLASLQTRNTAIGVDLLEKLTSKRVTTPDSEEGGVIIPDFTTPVKDLK